MVQSDFFNSEFIHRDKSILKQLNQDKLDSMSIWTEINSYIKGFANSYYHDNWHIPKKDYIHLVGKHKSSIDSELKEKIWEIAQLYEKWKVEIGAFDLMDFVSYMINEILLVKLLKLN